MLEGTKLILRYMDLYTRPPVTIAGIELSSKLIKYFVFLSMIVTTIPICIFSYVNIDNFIVASAGILFFMANLSIKLIYLELISRRNHIIDAINNFERLITKRIQINPLSVDLYGKKKAANEKLAQKLLWSGIYTVVYFFLPNAYPPITNRLFGWPKGNLYSFPFPVVVPFNTKKLAGFYIELCIQMFTVHFYMLIFSSTYSLFDSFNSFTDVMISDYTVASETLKQQLAKKMDRNRLRVKRFLADSIELHVGATRAMNDLRVMMSGPLFFELFTFVAFLAINVFIIDRSIREDNLFGYDTFFSLNNLLIQTIFCYMLCYFSTKMSFNANRFATITYDLTWYEYPVEQQKYIILMIERSQRSFGLSGYGIISCSMATFLSLFRRACSYYLILRNAN